MRLLVCAVFVPSMLAGSAAVGQCVGDCDGNGRVAIEELVLGVGIALDTASVDDCAALDADASTAVEVNELFTAVGNALSDCVTPPTTTPPPPTTTPTPDPLCGDGAAQFPQECDDGNLESGDGCDSRCQLEPGGNPCAGVATHPGDSLQSELISSAFSRPLFVTAPPLDPHRIFVVEQAGAIRVVKNGTLLTDPFLTVTVSCCGERGLLGLAFHPDFERNGRFFINYTNPAGDTVIARYQVSADPDRADDTSARVLLTIDQPFPNHNGGHLAFGPEGYLYVGMGDGGSFNDPNEAGQNDATLLAKLLRLDVDADVEPYYAVPPSNPRAAEGRPLGLIWAKGLRNPWRYTFDRLSHDLYIGDVGQNDLEEIDVQPAASVGGENYGWDIFEGSVCFEPRPLFPECPSPPTGYTMPVVEYGHDEGCSVTGGSVYRGCAGPSLHGTYFYADYCTSFIRSFVLQDGRATAERDWTATLVPGAGLDITGIASFGEDARGELYVCDLGDGEVFKLVPVAAGAPRP